MQSEEHPVLTHQWPSVPRETTRDVIREAIREAIKDAIREVISPHAPERPAAAPPPLLVMREAISMQSEVQSRTGAPGRCASSAARDEGGNQHAIRGAITHRSARPLRLLRELLRAHLRREERRELLRRDSAAVGSDQGGGGGGCALCEVRVRVAVAEEEGEAALRARQLGRSLARP